MTPDNAGPLSTEELHTLEHDFRWPERLRDPSDRITALVATVRDRERQRDEASAHWDSIRDGLVARLWSCDAERLRHKAERDELQRQKESR